MTQLHTHVFFTHHFTDAFNGHAKAGRLRASFQTVLKVHTDHQSVFSISPSPPTRPRASAPQPRVLPVRPGDERELACHLHVVDPLAVLVILPLSLPARFLVVAPALHGFDDSIQG